MEDANLVHWRCKGVYLRRELSWREAPYKCLCETCETVNFVIVDL